MVIIDRKSLQMKLYNRNETSLAEDVVVLQRSIGDTLDDLDDTTQEVLYFNDAPVGNVVCIVICLPLPLPLAPLLWMLQTLLITHEHLSDGLAFGGSYAKQLELQEEEEFDRKLPCTHAYAHVLLNRLLIMLIVDYAPL
jgi:hypothetical protein